MNLPQAMSPGLALVVVLLNPVFGSASDTSGIAEGTLNQRARGRALDYSSVL